jgi:predicted ATPase/DNA-binding SARP family transcriptional activator
VELRILGTPSIVCGDRSVDLSGHVGRVLLALLVTPGRAVRRDRLVDLLWGDEPPPTVRTALQVHVSRLRRLLADMSDCQATIETCADGYALRIADDAIDARRFEALLAGGRARLRAGDASHAVELFRDAVALWRGPAFDGYQHEAYFDPEAARLDGLRLDAEEECAHALIESGRAAEVVSEVDRLVSEEPWRERRWSLLMLAQYHSGRQVDALRTYQEARRILAAEVGVEPGRELQRLEWAILVHDPTLDRSSSALSPRPSTLPMPTVDLIGREQQLEAVERLLRERRIVTLTGPAGVGKTRLALELAHSLAEDCPDGVWWVELAESRASDLLAQHIATALGLRGLDRTASDEVVNAVVDHLASRDALLVLDNCEHLATACTSLLSRLASGTTRLRVLATSRERLDVAGTCSFPLPPLPVPERMHAIGDAEANPAVQLFAQRARDLDPTFRLDECTEQAIAELCRRLDGLPLAIELVAAWTRILSPDGMLDLVSHSADISSPSAGHPERHASIGTALDASYELLDEVEAAVFRRSSVFAGPFDREALGAIAGDVVRSEETVLRVLAGLVDKSLVDADLDTTRFRLLEPVRQYAAEQLRLSDAPDAARARHLAYYLELAERREPELRDLRQLEALSALDAAQSNLQAALGYALETGDHERALRLACALHWYWYLSGRWAESAKWLDDVVAATRDDASDLHRLALVRSFQSASTFASMSSHADEAECARQHAREVGDTEAEMWAASTVGIALWWRGEQLDRAASLFERAVVIAEENGDEWRVAWGRKFQGMLAARNGDVDRAFELMRGALATFDRCGDLFASGHTLVFIGHAARLLGRGDVARAAYREGVRRCAEVGAKGTLAHGLLGLAEVELSADATAAVPHLRRVLALVDETGNLSYETSAWRLLAKVAIAEGDDERARSQLRRALATARRSGTAGEIAAVVSELAAFAARLHDDRTAALLLARARTLDGRGEISVRPADARSERSIELDLRQRLGDAEFERCSRDGGALSLDEVEALG